METNPFVYRDKSSGLLVPTTSGVEYLKRITTDHEGPVYCFTQEADPLMAAAGMARLSRRGDDMRIIMLDEFANSPPEKMDGLFDRVITSYGDDSVQQLMPIMLVVENASNLLTKYIEWHRLAAYLEQSTRYIYFDQKDRNGRYRYYVPEHLPESLRIHYCEYMNKLFEDYSWLVRGLTDFVREKVPFQTNETEERKIKEARNAWLGATRAQACDAARVVLPVAVTSTVGIVASAQSLDSMIYQLSARILPEAQKTAVSILREVRKVAKPFFKRTDMSERGGAIVAHRRATREAMFAFAEKLGVGRKSAANPLNSYLLGNENNRVKLLDYWPRNELDLVADMLWHASSFSDDEIRRALEVKASEELLVEIFEAYIGERLNRRHRPGRAMELAHIKWELVGDYGIFRDIQRHRMVDAMDWQTLTPCYGYDIPEIIYEAGFEGKFRQCFALSLQLYEAVATAGFVEEAQYATLLGHLMRFRFMENAREAFHLHELRTSPQGHPGYRKLVQAMHYEFGKVYPRLATAMKFVNQGEDPELTRLAAERATQAKLALLG